MTAPLGTVNDMRSMDAAGRSRSEAARALRASRNTVAKYADMGNMSPAAPMPQRRGRPALEGNEEWVASVLEVDPGAPRKQRRTARRIYDRLVAERGYAGSYSTARRLVRELRPARAAAGGARLLFQVFADAYKRQSVVITTNLEFSRWESVFGDDQMAAAAIDRIVHHGRLVQFHGESHRVRHALMREG